MLISILTPITLWKIRQNPATAMTIEQDPRLVSCPLSSCSNSLTYLLKFSGPLLVLYEINLRDVILVDKFKNSFTL